MSVRHIKKYPNRRLYDTQTSKYINTDDLKKMIMSYESFTVSDVKTGEDITNSTIIQIISDLEASGNHTILTKEILFQLVRLYDNPMGAGFADYFEKTLDLFVRQREMVRDQMQKMVSLNPMSFMENLSGNPLQFWKEISDAANRKDKADDETEK